LDHVTFDWAYSVYDDLDEELPPDTMPTPRGNLVCTTTFEDANLMHNLTTGRSCTGILHLVNQTPVEWFSKCQKTVEIATYGSEFVAACIATEQIMDPTYTLRMMGVPLDGKSYMFGDNQSMITSGTLPHSSLNKCHNALAYHRVCEAIASDVIWFFHISGKINPSDVLTKLLGHVPFWPLIRPFLSGMDSLHKLRHSLFFGMGNPHLYRVVKHISYRGKCQLEWCFLLFRVGLYSVVHGCAWHGPNRAEPQMKGAVTFLKID
jgi:hypothetical protein